MSEVGKAVLEAILALDLALEIYHLEKPREIALGERAFSGLVDHLGGYAMTPVLEAHAASSASYRQERWVRVRGIVVRERRRNPGSGGST